MRLLAFMQRCIGQFNTLWAISSYVHEIVAITLCTVTTSPCPRVFGKDE